MVTLGHSKLSKLVVWNVSVAYETVRLMSPQDSILEE